jgi:hypothetical protein
MTGNDVTSILNYNQGTLIHTTAPSLGKYVQKHELHGTAANREPYLEAPMVSFRDWTVSAVKDASSVVVPG